MTTIKRIRNLAQIQNNKNEYAKQKAISYGLFGGVAAGVFSYCASKDITAKSCSKIARKLPGVFGLAGFVAGAIISGSKGISEAKEAYSKYEAKL